MAGRIEDTEVYKRACVLSDEVYVAVVRLPILARNTVGTQLIRSIDSVGANLVEGDGKGPGADAIRFFRIARGSCREARHWIDRAVRRQLIDSTTGEKWLSETGEIVAMIHGLIRFRQANPMQARENLAEYDPFTISE